MLNTKILHGLVNKGVNNTILRWSGWTYTHVEYQTTQPIPIHIYCHLQAKSLPNTTTQESSSAHLTFSPMTYDALPSFTFLWILVVCLLLRSGVKNTRGCLQEAQVKPLMQKGSSEAISWKQLSCVVILHMKEFPSLTQREALLAATVCSDRCWVNVLPSPLQATRS